MRRPAKGGTTRPGPARPGYGYGRPLRPCPRPELATRRWPDATWWVRPVAESGEREPA